MLKIILLLTFLSSIPAFSISKGLHSLITGLNSFSKEFCEINNFFYGKILPPNTAKTINKNITFTNDLMKRTQDKKTYITDSERDKVTAINKFSFYLSSDFTDKSYLPEDSNNYVKFPHWTHFRNYGTKEYQDSKIKIR